MEREELLQDALTGVIYGGLDKERKEVITADYQDITVNDMHILDRVGVRTAKNMSSVAKELKVTTGTLTIAVNSLVKKGYLARERSEKDKRVVLISLTEKGIRAYRHHQEYHTRMVKKLMQEFTEDEGIVLLKALQKIQAYFET